MGDVGVAQIEHRHHPAMHLLGIEAARLLEERRQIRFATMLGDACQVRGEIGTFSHQRVAVHAVGVMPDVLASQHLFGDLVRVGQLTEPGVAVQRQTHEHRGEDARHDEEERGGLSHGHGGLLTRRPGPSS
jgi:hypothetical protein